MKKSCRKCASKASPRLLLLNNPKQPLYGRNFFKNNILKEDYQKALKKLTLFFLLNPVLFNRQCYKKQKVSGTSDQPVFRLRSKFKNIPLFVIYHLTNF